MYLNINLFLSDFKPSHWLFFQGNEFWKPVKNYEDFYEISTKARVKNILTNRFLKLFPCPKGYFMVYLYKPNCKRYNLHIHRLVALTFLKNPLNKPQVNHKAGKSNFISNLEWCTAKENIHHAITTGLRTKDINLRSQNLFKKTDILDIKNLIKRDFKNSEIAFLYNCHHSTISKIRTNKHYSK